MKLVGSSEEKNGVGKGRRFLEALLGALLVMAAVVAGSVFVVCRMMPEAGGFFAWGDGYYRIYTAGDYKRFWELAREKPSVKGRLMADIYLNNASDYENWGSVPPSRKNVKVDSFYGVFDGNGHTVYGLYSPWGYGLVKENGGEIYDLAIRKSFIKGDAKVGGFCQSNISTISGCVFDGTIANNRAVMIKSWERTAGGICAVNSGKIEKCGYEGRMSMTDGWNQKGFHGGICAWNFSSGEIARCYNISCQDEVSGEGYYYAITNGAAKDSFCLKNSDWWVPEEGVRKIEKEQVAYLSTLLEGDLFKLYWQERHLPEYGAWLEEQQQNLQEARKQLKDQRTDWQSRKIPVWEPPVLLPQENALNGLMENVKCGMISEQSQKELAMGRLLQDEQAARFVKVLMEDEKEQAAGIPEGEIVSAPGEELSVAVWFGSGEERIKLGLYPCEAGCFQTDTGGMDYEALWEACSGILGKPAGDDFLHATWRISYDADWEKEAGIFVLYVAEEKAAGLFYIIDGRIYQAEAGNGGQRDGLAKLKEQIQELEELREKEGSGSEEEGIEEVIEEVVREVSQNELWTAIFCSLWQDGTPEDGFCWQDENMRHEVYSACSCYDRDVPAIEDIVELKELQIHNGYPVGTFQDLRKLPNLAGLSVEGGDCNFDLTGDMAPSLRELFIEGATGASWDFLEEMPRLTMLGIVYSELTDISFLQGLPELTEISFYGNRIQDISPVSNCQKLQVLSLAYNEVTDITPLAGLPELKEAGLQGNGIREVNALANLKEMEKLNLSSNELTDLAPLEGLKGLKALGVADNHLTDIAPLAEMEQMYNLELGYNEIEDISPLKGMARMEYLGLSRNRIKDYGPIMGMENLYSLSVVGNPGQDIGEMLFVPWLTMGSSYPAEEGALQQAQDCLDSYYPGQDIWAEDITRGDLNGDGVEDMAITGLINCEEDVSWSGERYIYPFISRGDGTFDALEALESLGPGMGGIYGDPYQGVAITGQMLAVQVYGGSNWRWGCTEIYEYQEGQMKEKQRLNIGHFVYNSGMDFSINDIEKNYWENYVAVGEQEGHKELLLVSEEKGEVNPRQEELEKKLEEFETGRKLTLPEITKSDTVPALDGWYDYHIYDFETEKDPSWVLGQAAEEFLEEAVALPIPVYASEQIKESYDKLIGVELPEVFYIGFLDGKPALLYYNNCILQEDGGYVHEIAIQRPDGEYWTWEKAVYFYEDMETFA